MVREGKRLRVAVAHAKQAARCRRRRRPSAGPSAPPRAPAPLAVTWLGADVVVGVAMTTAVVVVLDVGAAAVELGNM